MFDRIINLIGKEKFELLKESKVLIVGCGGVGGYALETLVRSGIYNIGIVDFDKIDVTNINRQIISTFDNVGKLKIDVAIKRVKDINPNVNIKGFNLFLSQDNIDILKDYDFIIDACDTVDTKIEIIKYSLENNVKLISCMGTAKKIDPTLLKITTLDKTSYDPLARIIRKRVKDLKIKSKIYVVSSNEVPMKSEGLGTFMMVPASAGILCAKYVIDYVLKVR